MDCSILEANWRFEILRNALDQKSQFSSSFDVYSEGNACYVASSLMLRVDSDGICHCRTINFAPPKMLILVISNIFVIHVDVFCT